MEIAYKSKNRINNYITEHITRREFEILTLMGEGYVNKQIAAVLSISAETVKQHVKNIYLKTGAHTKIEALNKTKWLTASLQPTDTYCYL